MNPKIKNFMYYVYLLQSLEHSEKIYIGYTNNLKNRLEAHNAGLSIHTAKYKPWHIITHIGFTSKNKAILFEKYLKSGSGRVFIKKHLI